MLRAVADTHAVIWYLFADDRLSDTVLPDIP
jgi:PIN domain nuclease of toxin-antitoxin system